MKVRKDVGIAVELSGKSKGAQLGVLALVMFSSIDLGEELNLAKTVFCQVSMIEREAREDLCI